MRSWRLLITFCLLFGLGLASLSGPVAFYVTHAVRLKLLGV